MLRAIWEQQDATKRQVAWRSALRVIRRQVRQPMLDDARGRLGAWVNNYLTATALEYGNFLISRSGLAASEVRKAALPPMLDAVAGTIAADGISAKELAVLLEPMTVLSTKESST
jgi:hypothetical protein